MYGHKNNYYNFNKGHMSNSRSRVSLDGLTIFHIFPAIIVGIVFILQYVPILILKTICAIIVNIILFINGVFDIVSSITIKDFITLCLVLMIVVRVIC